MRILPLLSSPTMVVCPVLLRRRGSAVVWRGVFLTVVLVVTTFSSEHYWCSCFEATAITSAMTTATATAFYQENSWKLRRTEGAISSTSSSHLHAQPSPEQEPDQERKPPQFRPLLERPPPRTETAFETFGPKSIPSTPKIVVLGATGKIGRHVVRQLLALNIELTVVAYVRDYQKALRIFYDDVLLVPNAAAGRLKPKLQIVEGDLVAFDVATAAAAAGTKKTRHDVAEDTQAEDEAVWQASAASTAAFYPTTTIDEYDNRHLLPDVDEVLIEAIRDCTTIISCVGTVRPTHLWRDILAPWPWPFLRLFHADVSGWCHDPTHPYYVHYCTTRKVVGYAEKEQIKREAAVLTLAEDDEETQKKNSQTNEDDEPILPTVPKIRFIRISDLSVVYHAWHLVPVLANSFRSLIFRYHELSEQVLEESTLLDTITIRPGDVVDEERDPKTTWVQVTGTSKNLRKTGGHHNADAEGRVPSPHLIGRVDVAALVVAAALFPKPIDNNDDSHKTSKTNTKTKKDTANDPIHYTFAARWTGVTLESYPNQGTKRNGHINAAIAFKRSLATIDRQERDLERRNRGEQLRRGVRPNNHNDDDGVTTRNGDGGGRGTTRRSTTSQAILRMAEQVAQRRRRKNRRRTKPYGLVVAVAIYVSCVVVSKILLLPALQYIPGGTDYLLPSLQRVRSGIQLGVTGFLGRVRLVWWPRIISSALGRFRKISNIRGHPR